MTLSVNAWLLCVWFVVGCGSDPQETIDPQQCALNNGQCSYHVTLSHDCNPQHREISNEIQNDYSSKVNEIEKSLLRMQVEYTQKIAELEKRVSTSQPVSYMVSPRLEEDQNGTVSESRENVSVPARPEHGLLEGIHEQFTILRRELSDTKRQLRRTESTLRETEQALNMTEVKLLSTTRTLLATEHQLDVMTLERDDLHESLSVTTNQLNSTQFELEDTKRRLSIKRESLRSVSAHRDRLSSRLSTCQTNLRATNDSYLRLQDEYYYLNILNANTSTELERKLELLVECQTGKTSVRCGFEDAHICGFLQDKEDDDFDWTWWRLHTPSVETGPVNDHTCSSGLGHYMYVEASGKGRGQRGRLFSPRFFGLDEQCVEFYYHMRGFHVGTLNVFTNVTGHVPLMRPPTFSVYGNQGPVWTRATIDIPKEITNIGYHVTFEVILERGYQGDIAIDDFSVADGDCASQAAIREVKRRRPGHRRRVKNIPEN